MEVSRSITIQATPQEIQEKLTDFHTWPVWSPWLISEPTAKINVAVDGNSYSWDGKRVGAGEMSIKSVGDKKLDYNLTFLKPWKSKADVSFKLSEINEGTLVTWDMKSSLPFFLFFMKQKMEAFIGNDYERGLTMLKEFIEKGHVNSKLEVLGISHFEAMNYVGIHRTTTMDGMKQSMGKDFGQLMSEFQAGNGNWFTIYHKFDFVKDKVSYTACVGLDEIPSSVDKQYTSGTIESGKMHTVRHVGAYDHIGNAWSTSMMMMRNKEFKPKKGIHPMEFYRNSPENTPPSELISDISFVVK